MKFDKFLAKLFSKKVIVFMVAVIITVMMLTSCLCKPEDVVLCYFCGCVTPETACNICNYSCDCTGNCIVDCSDGYRGCVWGVHDALCGAMCGPSEEAALSCIRDCFTDDEGNPIDCGDVGCPECQKYFECE